MDDLGRLVESGFDRRCDSQGINEMKAQGRRFLQRVHTGTFLSISHCVINQSSRYALDLLTDPDGALTSHSNNGTQQRMAGCCPRPVLQCSRQMPQLVVPKLGYHLAQ